MKPFQNIFAVIVVLLLFNISAEASDKPGYFGAYVGQTVAAVLEDFRPPAYLSASRTPFVAMHYPELEFQGSQYHVIFNFIGPLITGMEMTALGPEPEMTAVRPEHGFTDYMGKSLDEILVREERLQKAFTAFYNGSLMHQLQFVPAKINRRTYHTQYLLENDRVFIIMYFSDEQMPGSESRAFKDTMLTDLTAYLAEPVWVGCDRSRGLDPNYQGLGLFMHFAADEAAGISMLGNIRPEEDVLTLTLGFTDLTAENPLGRMMASEHLRMIRDYWDADGFTNSGNWERFAAISAERLMDEEQTDEDL